MEIPTKPNPTESDIVPSSDGTFEDAGSHEEDVPFEYKLLKGHMRPDGKTWLSDQELRMEYLQLTDELIRNMTQEHEVTNPQTGEKEMRKPTVAVFLDKSARPLSHLVRNMWPIFANDPETGEIPPMPDFKFLNIDREQWINKIDPYGTGIMDVDNIDPSIIRSLRSIFLTHKDKERVQVNGLTEDIDTMPTILDDESIIIIDETRSTGRTTRIATDLLKRAFPSTHIDSAHWMRQTFTRNGAQYTSVPVWYQENSVWGRGVNNRYADFQKGQEEGATTPLNYYRKMGRWFLSSPHHLVAPEGTDSHDELYYQLIREFKELSTNPDVPILPSRSRKDMEERVVAYNYDKPDASLLDEDQKNVIIDDVIKHKQSIHRESANRPRP